MFGRRSKPTSSTMGGFHTETTVVADPDLPNIGRMRTLAIFDGFMLDGQASGTRVNYDRGDAGRSLRHIIPTVADPNAAANAITRYADPATTQAPPEFNTQGTAVSADGGNGNAFLNQSWARYR